MDDIWFQQEICHTARKTIQLLHLGFRKFMCNC